MLLIIVLALMVLVFCAQGRLLSKSGENGWKILIPVYGGYLLYKACDAVGLFIANMCLSGFSFLLGLAGAGEVMTLVIMAASLILNIFFCIRMAKAYGKGGGFAVGLIFLPIIFQCILAFGDAEHVMYKAQWHAANHVKNASTASSTWQCPACGAQMPMNRVSCSDCGQKRN